MNSLWSAVNPSVSRKFYENIRNVLMKIEIVENRYKNIELFSKNILKINQKHQDLVDIVQQKISNFDELYNHLKFQIR